MNNGEFTAQLCKIKAFRHSAGFINDGNKTRNQLGDEKADILSSNNGWNQLLSLLNSSIDCDEKKIQFEPYNSAHVISFDYEKQTIRFPKLKYELGNGHKETLSIRISPCVSREVHTKILTRPTFLCSTDELLRSPDKVNVFFEKTVGFTDKVFGVVKDFYTSKIKKDNNPVELNPYCDAEIFVIGYKEFKQWVEFAVSNNKNQIVNDAKNKPSVELSRGFLNNLKKDGEEYKWFSRRRDSINAIYGIYGRENYCKVLGIADDRPGLITAELTQELIALMDSAGSC